MGIPNEALPKSKLPLRRVSEMFPQRTYTDYTYNMNVRAIHAAQVHSTVNLQTVEICRKTHYNACL